MTLTMTVVMAQTKESRVTRSIVSALLTSSTAAMPSVSGSHTTAMEKMTVETVQTKLDVVSY